MSVVPETYKVAALYHFVSLDDPARLRSEIMAECEEKGIRGTLLLAREGINGTIAGEDAAIDGMIAFLKGLDAFTGLEVKYSTAGEMPFLRMKVRLKKEIVAMGVDDIDAANGKGEYVAPEHWNALIADPATILIDTRNAYEVAIGSFAGAIDPGTDSFREFPGWFDKFTENLPLADGGQPKIAMFCTGGIRCEKATAYVKKKGFDNVFHLQGGILKYLEQVAETESRWEGDCFLFDQRVAVGHGLTESDFITCHACRMPLRTEELELPEYEEGVSCPHCFELRSEDQRGRYRERQRQVELAQKRGKAHLGA